MRHRFSRPCRIFLLQLLVAWIWVVLPAPVHAAGEEETVARNFLKFLRSEKAILSSETLQGNRLAPALAPVTVGYLFHLEGGGYLLISSGRIISPVKGYSLTHNFSGLPEPYRKALLEELELRARVASEGEAGRAPLEVGTSEIAARWDFLLGWEAGRAPLDYSAGSALLQTRWNQTDPYNKFLPQIGGQTVVTGCVNVAVAQVMRYHHYPAASQGVVSYRWNGPPEQTLKTILYRGYNWDNMPAEVGSTTPEYQADEVALLIRDIGIANQTDFDIAGSSTSLNSRMLLENFGYSTALSNMTNTDFGPFLAMLKAEIGAERPVLLSLPGHMTVADGYRTDGTGDSIHINLGWGGSDDDFYFLDQPIQAGGYNFPVSAGALRIYYGIKPCSAAAGDCVVNLEAGDAAAGLALSGNFNWAMDTDLHEVYLKGSTTIRGTRGYANLYFFMSIIRMSDGSEVFPAPDPGGAADMAISAGSLAAGKYTIRVSLCSADGYCYTPSTGYDHYSVTLTSGTLTAGEKATADQELERAPVIGNVLPDLVLKANGGTRRILIDARDENGDAITLSVQNSNPAAVGAVLSGNVLEVTPTGTAKVSSRIAVTAEAKGVSTTGDFIVLTDSQETGFGRSYSLAGIFSGQSDVKTHRAVLDGDCTITGLTTGYNGQYFYSSVRNADGSPRIAAADTTISGNFPRGIYLLTASLQQNPGGYGSYYPYTQGTADQYSLVVSCPDADAGTTTIAGILGIDLAGANLPFDKPGDVNGDGSVTLADALLLMRMLSGRDETILSAGDANGDRKIGLAEALFILQGVAGLRESGP